MAHIHSVYDTDGHFVIDPITRAITNSSKKIKVMQGDHKSEHFTFEISKLVDGHNMTFCNKVEIHYINIDASDKSKQSADFYEAKNMKVSEDNNSVVTFLWELTRNATKYAGTLSFLIRFACTDDDGVEEYAWHTDIFQSITVGNGMNNATPEVIEPYIDVIAQWKANLFGVGDTEEQRLLAVSAEQQAAIEAKGAAVLDSIPEEYTALNQNVEGNAAKIKLLANAIKGNISGAVVRADDVSPMEHNIAVKAKSKNLYNINAVTYESANNAYTASGNRLQYGKTYTVISDTPMGWFKVATNHASGFVCAQKTDYANGFTMFTFILEKNPNAGEGAPLRICVDNREQSAKGDLETLKAMNIRVVEGDSFAAYTPYTDPATVTVKRCGKNLAYQNNFAIGGTVNSAGSIGGLGNTVLVKDIKITKGESYIISMDKPAEVTTPKYFLYNGNLSALTHTATYNEIVPNGRGIEKTVSSGAILATGEYEYIAITTGGASTFAAGEVNFEITKLQLEIGSSATEFEPYNGAEYTPAADGAVSGVTSLSPYMTILTDTDGAIVECEYNIDTKTYIDNKIAEMMKGLME